eukprot:scpid85209/ scgid27430/ 
MDPECRQTGSVYSGRCTSFRSTAVLLALTVCTHLVAFTLASGEASTDVSQCAHRTPNTPWLKLKQCTECTCQEDGILACNTDLCRTCTLAGVNSISACCRQCTSDSKKGTIVDGNGRKTSGQRAENCPLQSWSGWSACSATCGNGMETQSAVVLLPTSDNDRRCIRQQRTRKCHTGVECPNEIECSETQWSSWSACSATCRGGMRHRSRVVRRVPSSGLADCSQEVGQSACNTRTSCNKASPPSRISGLVTGTINGKAVSGGQYAGQSSAERGTVATMGGIPKSVIPSISPLLPLLWPVYWISLKLPSSASDLPHGFGSGFELTHAEFSAQGTFVFPSSDGAVLSVTFNGQGLDSYGQARIDMKVNGTVPELESGSVRIGTFKEHHRWTRDR